MEDPVNVIQRKIWTADGLLSQLDTLADNAERLSPQERKGIPVFSHDWTEAAIRKHVKEVEKSVSDPIKYKNKARLEKIGVDTNGISDDVLGDTLAIGETLNLLEQISGTSDSIIEVLIHEGVLARWLRDGAAIAKERLQGIVNAKPAFKRVVESEVDPELKSELLKKSIADVSLLTECEDVIFRFTYLHYYQIALQYEGDFEKYCKNLDDIWGKIQQIQNDYGISREQLKDPISNKTLEEASQLLKAIQEEYAKQKGKLREEWAVYSSTLTSLGKEVSEPPERLKELAEAIASLRAQCLEYLGESGIRLLRFLKEEDDFPADLGLVEIQRALETLRPFFLRSLMGGE